MNDEQPAVIVQRQALLSNGYNEGCNAPAMCLKYK